MYKIGDKVNDFSLKDKDQVSHSLSDYLGKKVVIYFYPKDLTPGCTMQACSFRDAYKSYQDKNAVIIGISRDKESSHEKFALKYDLPFVLLSDTNKEVAHVFGVLKEKSMFGKKYMSYRRSAFVIDEKGYLTHIFEDIKASSSASIVLEVL